MIKASPVIYAAVGAVVSYYCLFPPYRSGIISVGGLLVLAFVPVAFLCLLWGLDSFQSDFFFGRRLLRLLIIRTAAFAAGLAAGIASGAGVSDIVNLGIPEKTVLGISGTLLDDPRVLSNPGAASAGGAMSALSLKMATGKGGVRATAHGQVTVFFREDNAERLREFGRGTEVFAEGELRPAKAAAVGAGGYTFTAESLHITKKASVPERFRTGLRLGLTDRFAGSGPGRAWAGLSLALLLGVRDNLDTGLAGLYRDAGCSYILALSGMHLAILVSLVSFLLKPALGLKGAAAAGAVIIAAYCFIVGPLPSLNRAALMYLLGVVAVLGMLKKDMLALLCTAFLIQIAVTPGSGFSPSFILSYLALAGILVIGGAVNECLAGKIPDILLKPLSASLGAFIATAGVSAWFFTVLRPAGIAAGLVLAPLAGVFMVLSVAWLGLDIISPVLSFLPGKILSLLYRLMEKTAAAGAAVPGIRANPFLVILLSLLITLTLLLLARRRRIIAAPAFAAGGGAVKDGEGGEGGGEEPFV